MSRITLNLKKAGYQLTSGTDTLSTPQTLLFDRRKPRRTQTRDLISRSPISFLNALDTDNISTSTLASTSLPPPAVHNREGHPYRTTFTQLELTFPHSMTRTETSNSTQSQQEQDDVELTEISITTSSRSWNTGSEEMSKSKSKPDSVEPTYPQAAYLV